VVVRLLWPDPQARCLKKGMISHRAR
jgi:hypothetical protein